MQLNNDQWINIHETKGGKSNLYVKYEQASFRGQVGQHQK